MPLHILNEKLWFPPVEDAVADGLLAIGGDISFDRLLLAYRNGIFPWYDDDVPLWWSPDPRFVLFPDELRVSKSMQRTLSNDSFEFRMNTAFEDVMRNCKSIPRKMQQGTWINETLIHHYVQLHKAGYALSAEAWHRGTLAGGLYAVKLGNVLFGESMFSKESNASKFAFIRLVQKLQKEGLKLIDCQVYTQHLESLGARMIDRKEFMQILHAEIHQDY